MVLLGMGFRGFGVEAGWSGVGCSWVLRIGLGLGLGEGSPDGSNSARRVG